MASFPAAYIPRMLKASRFEPLLGEASDCWRACGIVSRRFHPLVLKEGTPFPHRNLICSLSSPSPVVGTQPEKLTKALEN
jgi:hypothetical protein